MRHAQIASFVHGASDLGHEISRGLEVTELALPERLVAARPGDEPAARLLQSGMRVTEHGADQLGTPRHARPLDHLRVPGEHVEKHPLLRLARALESRQARHAEEERESPVGPGRVEQPDEARRERVGELSEPPGVVGAEAQFVGGRRDRDLRPQGPGGR